MIEFDEYKVKLQATGVASTGYCVVKFVDHATNQEKCYSPGCTRCW